LPSRHPRQALRRAAPSSAEAKSREPKSDTGHGAFVEPRGRRDVCRPPLSRLRAVRAAARCGAPARAAATLVQPLSLDHATRWLHLPGALIAAASLCTLVALRGGLGPRRRQRPPHALRGVRGARGRRPAGLSYVTTVRIRDRTSPNAPVLAVQPGQQTGSKRPKSASRNHAERRRWASESPHG